MTVFDLDKYLSRVGYYGEGVANYETLKALHYLHPQAIPFENIDPFLGKQVNLDLEAIQQKMVTGRRGGYCFEQNSLFGNALAALGFSVRGLTARVVWDQAEDAVTARTHTLLLIDLDGERYIADVGFGGVTQTSPLLLAPELYQTTPHEPFRIMETEGGFRVQVRVNETWRSLYNFDLAQQPAKDCEIISYYLSTNPKSRFVTDLLAARPLPDRRYSLHNGRLTTYFAKGGSSQRHIASGDELIDVLEGLFEIAVPDPTAFKTILHAKEILKRRAS